MTLKVSGEIALKKTLDTVLRTLPEIIIRLAYL